MPRKSGPATMAVTLGPGKFYGNSLPRPRFYNDVKFNSDRVDPPIPVMDPLLSWAQEAHWSMGGLNFERLRLQGRIEGSVDKLRKFREKQVKSQTKDSPKGPKDQASEGGNSKKEDRKRAGSVSPPPAPRVTKRRRYMDLFDEDSDEEEQEVVEKVGQSGKKWLARKLVGDFDRVANESEVNKNGKVGDLVGVRTRRRALTKSGSVGEVMTKVIEELKVDHPELKKMKGGKKGKSDRESGSVASSGIRTSPRLAKQRSG